MRKSIRLLSAAGLLFASVAAHAVDDTYVFSSISSVEPLVFNGVTINLTGILATTSASTTLSVPISTGDAGRACAKYYDVMLDRPDVFTLSITIRTIQSTGPGGFPETIINLIKCSLTRNP